MLGATERSRLSHEWRDWSNNNRELLRQIAVARGTSEAQVGVVVGCPDMLEGFDRLGFDGGWEWSLADLNELRLVWTTLAWTGSFSAVGFYRGFC